MSSINSVAELLSIFDSYENKRPIQGPIGVRDEMTGLLQGLHQRMPALNAEEPIQTEPVHALNGGDAVALRYGWLAVRVVTSPTTWRIAGTLAEFAARYFRGDMQTLGQPLRDLAIDVWHDFTGKIEPEFDDPPDPRFSPDGDPPDVDPGPPESEE